MSVVSRLVSLIETSCLRSLGLRAGHVSNGLGQANGETTHLTPAIPSTTRFSPVMVPVLSKQHTSTRPAKGMRNGSVQKMAKGGTGCQQASRSGGHIDHAQNFPSATSD